MATNDELLAAAKLLKDSCTECVECCGCVFYEDDACLLVGYPSRFTIPAQSRWTNEDVALAKVLRAVGAKTVLRFAGQDKVMWTGFRTGGILPTDCFKSLQPGESRALDDIINRREDKNG